jgi:Mor family transcriptional regulator
MTDRFYYEPREISVSGELTDCPSCGAALGATLDDTPADMDFAVYDRQLSSLHPVAHATTRELAEAIAQDLNERDVRGYL